LAKKGVTESFPFDDDTLVFKIGNKMFALTSLKSWENGKPSINLKCDPERSLELRATFEDIIEGYHMSKVHWNTIYINKSVTDQTVTWLLNHSFDLVFSSLSKKIQMEISEL
jgi:predicted DNA-binding protein (MmcQ/YjbR family)